tara:strand:+ start:108 stop:416 length:309 start_codon:yes stop_codon:yes gene_type:complete
MSKYGENDAHKKVQKRVNDHFSNNKIELISAFSPTDFVMKFGVFIDNGGPYFLNMRSENCEEYVDYVANNTLTNKQLEDLLVNEHIDAIADIISEQKVDILI